MWQLVSGFQRFQANQHFLGVCLGPFFLFIQTEYCTGKEWEINKKENRESGISAITRLYVSNKCNQFCFNVVKLLRLFKKNIKYTINTIYVHLLQSSSSLLSLQSIAPSQRLLNGMHSLLLQLQYTKQCASKDWDQLDYLLRPSYTKYTRLRTTYWKAPAWHMIQLFSSVPSSQSGEPLQ